MHLILAIMVAFGLTWSDLNESDDWDCYVEQYPDRIDTHVCERIDSCYGDQCDVRLEFDGPNTTRLRQFVTE